MRKTVYSHLTERGGLRQHKVQREIPQEAVSVVKPAIDRSCNSVCEIAQRVTRKGVGVEESLWDQFILISELN
jgi:hypothetical protein